MVFEVRIPDLGQAGYSLPAVVADDRNDISGYQQIP